MRSITPLRVGAVALALGLALAAAWAQSRDRKAIDVQVVNGATVVPEEEAVTTRDEGGLVWRLVTPGYAFTADGVVLDPPGAHRCQVQSDGQRFRCAKLKHESGARFKYVVNLVDQRTGQRLEPLDPWILND